MMEELLLIVIYCVLGTGLMILGNMVVDWVIPCHFPTEIKKGNVAVGCVTAGISVAIGIIIKAAIMSPQAAAVEESILEGVASTVYYYAIGLIFCIIGYFITLLLNRKYDLNKEIGDGNPAAGIMTAGIFVGLAIVISGVIM